MGPRKKWFSELWIMLALAAWAVPAAALRDSAVRVLVLTTSSPVEVARSGAPAREVSLAPGGQGLLVDGRPARMPLRIIGPVLRLGGFRYRGSLELHGRGSRILAVNAVDLEDYVAGTVHREIFSGWDGEALRAQAVATRTYALYRASRARDPLHHLDATVGDQVYGGIAAETVPARRAARATRGEYLSFEGEPILAAFHAASGGVTASAEEVWGHALPYLVSVSVPNEEIAPDTYWRAAFAADDLAQRLDAAGLGVGTVRDLTVVAHSPSGRAARVAVSGSARLRELSGRRLRQILGSTSVRSTFYRIERQGVRFVVAGSGYGHGVGMSQWGARAMARRGASYREILSRFYPGAEIRHLEEEATVAAKRRGR